MSDQLTAAFYITKGGVGKTTSCAHIARALARERLPSSATAVVNRHPAIEVYRLRFYSRRPPTADLSHKSGRRENLSQLHEKVIFTDFNEQQCKIQSIYAALNQ